MEGQKITWASQQMLYHHFYHSYLGDRRPFRATFGGRIQQRYDDLHIPDNSIPDTFTHHPNDQYEDLPKQSVRPPALHDCTRLVCWQTRPSKNTHLTWSPGEALYQGHSWEVGRDTTIRFSLSHALRSIFPCFPTFSQNFRSGRPNDGSACPSTKPIQFREITVWTMFSRECALCWIVQVHAWTTSMTTISEYTLSALW